MTDTMDTGNTDQPQDASIWSTTDPGTIDLNQLWNELQNNPLAAANELSNPPHTGDAAPSGLPGITDSSVSLPAGPSPDSAQPASDSGEDWSTAYPAPHAAEDQALQQAEAAGALFNTTPDPSSIDWNQVANDPQPV